MDKVIPGMYRSAKDTCDKYFLIEFRGETRGIGGTFYDDLNKGDPKTLFKF